MSFPSPMPPVAAPGTDASSQTRSWHRIPARHWVLLGITFYTMTLAGAAAATGQFSAPLAFDPSWLATGLAYSVCLVAILGAHEMGHYLACLHYRVNASPPWFLPAPPPLGLFGTFGAFIRIRAPIPHRRALFDIGVAGPLAGFVVALPVLLWGLANPTLVAAQDEGAAMGVPLLMGWITLMFHELPEGQTILWSGPVMAGWVGCLATALNLFPIGQLDGGHLCYAISPRLHHAASRLMLAAFVILGLLVYPGWLFFALLMIAFGPRHPPVLIAEPGLNRARLLVALLAFVILAICFIPVPLDLEGP